MQQQAKKRLKKLIVPLLAPAIAFFLMILIIIAPVALIATVVLGNPVGKFIASFGCTLAGLFGSEPPICKLLDEVNSHIPSADKARLQKLAEMHLLEALDCANVSQSDRLQHKCIPGLLALVEQQQVIPSRALWLVPVWQKAATKYKEDWMLLAAVNGARTDFGLADCNFSDRAEAGFYRIADAAWAQYTVDAGHANTQPGTLSGCEQSNAPPSYKKDKVYDPYDAVDSTFTEANILANKGAGGQSTWNYTGGPLSPIGFDQRDGQVYVVPLSASGSGGSVTITGGPLTDGQRKFAEAFAQGTGLDVRVVAAWELAEQSGSAAVYYQSMNYNNWLNIGNTTPAATYMGSFWSDPTKAGQVSAQWMHGQGPIVSSYGHPAAGIQAILHTAGQSPDQQIAAIAASGWAASGYNGGADLRATYQLIQGSTTTSGSGGVPAPVVPGGPGWHKSVASWEDPGNDPSAPLQLANGDNYNGQWGVANKTLPLGTLVALSYNGKSTVAVVDDRGPYVAGRDFDLLPPVAQALGFTNVGVGTVQWKIVGSTNPKASGPFGSNSSGQSGPGAYADHCEYSGPKQTDPVSKSLFWAYGNNYYSTCYVAAVHDWYQAIQQNPPACNTSDALSGNSNWQKIANALSAKGFSRTTIAGILGNFGQENGGQTITGISTQINSGGIGIAQWIGGRATAERAYASSHNEAPDSIEAQVGFLLQELNTNYHGAYVAAAAATTPQAAADAFEKYYEGAGAPNLPEREKLAVQAYGMLGNLGGGGGSPDASAAADSCSLDAGGYVNPFAHATHMIPQRIDMGVDYDGAGPIDAIGAAKITEAGTGVGGGWVCEGGPNGAVVYQLLGGKYKGKYVYVAEDINPTVHVGQTVAAGQQIGTFPAYPSDCIEIGWSQGPQIEPWAAVLGQIPGSGDAGDNRTFCGQQMSDLIKATGGIAGLTEGKPISGDHCV